MKISINALSGIVIGAALVWAALMAFVPGAKQERLFYADGREMLSDYVMPRQCAAAADPYAAEAVEPKDRCYAALGYAIAAAFPKDTFKGGFAESDDGESGGDGDVGDGMLERVERVRGFGKVLINTV